MAPLCSNATHLPSGAFFIIPLRTVTLRHCLSPLSSWFFSMALNHHLSHCILPWSCVLPVSFPGCQSCRTRTVGCCVHCCVPGAWNSTWHSLCLNKCLLNKLNEWMTVGMLPKFSASQKHKWVKQQLPAGLRVGETIVVGEGAALNFWEWLPYVWGGSRPTAPANSCHRRAGSLLPDFKAFLLRKARKWLKKVNSLEF